MSHRKPLIGITGPERGGISAWLFSRFAVWLQGGKAVRITPDRPQFEGELDGLILGGGADIDPRRYGESLLDELTDSNRPKPFGFRAWVLRVVSFLFYPILLIFRKLFSTRHTGSSHARDELEFALLEKALDGGIPVLGICRGAQLINVHLGGTLHQDIDSFYREVPKINTIWPEKRIEIAQGSRLNFAMGVSAAWVNALHHQAVDRLGRSLKTVARETTGITQAIEDPDHPFLLGVQWHPEYMPQIPEQRSIFRSLVEQAAKSAERT